MARRDVESNEVIVNVPLRRLLTGVPRTQRAAAAIPRIKRYVRRHVPTSWLDAVATDEEPDGKLWIDDSLNMTIWRRGREHVAGPAEWEEPKGGGPPRLARRSSVRYGSVLKVRVLLNENPEESDPRLELSLPGVEHITRQERRDRKRGGPSKEDEGEADEEGAEEGGQPGRADGDEEGGDEQDEEEAPGPAGAKPAPKKPAPAKAPAKEPSKKPKKAKKEEGED